MSSYLRDTLNQQASVLEGCAACHEAEAAQIDAGKWPYDDEGTAAERRQLASAYRAAAALLRDKGSR